MLRDCRGRGVRRGYTWLHRIRNVFEKRVPLSLGLAEYAVIRGKCIAHRESSMSRGQEAGEHQKQSSAGPE